MEYTDQFDFDYKGFDPYSNQLYDDELNEMLRQENRQYEDSANKSMFDDESHSTKHAAGNESFTSVKRHKDYEEVTDKSVFLVKEM